MRSFAWAAALGLAGLLAAFLLGAPVAAAAAGLAVVLVALRPRLLPTAVLPGPLVVALLALFAAAGALANADPVHHAVVAHLDTPWRLSIAGALGSAVATNLATTLVLLPGAASAAAHRALLVGVDLGVGLAPVGSLATILWRDTLRGRGEPVPMARYLAVGIPLSLVLVPLATALVS